jgi:5'-nucleotidase/UDP-sugar diphosphatase
MTAQRIEKLTILHSNDMHGDFLAEAQGAEGKLIGGLALLSGYIKRVRQEEENVLYVISGDMVQGSVIDAEYKGVSTIEIMNFLAPDVVTLGNHELDYGLAHLLFLEKMANFPVVNGNLYIKKHHKRLMRPYLILNVAGLDIMFLGIITEAVLGQLKSDEIGTYIGIEDACAEVGRICNAYRDSDIDLTVILTHIGFEEDLKLAAMLHPEWGVDMIIGGHSHTILEQPAVVNNILVTQAGIGTDQIGRFDILVNGETNTIVEWKWQLVQVDEDLVEPDQDLQAFIDSYQQAVDRKYSGILCRMAQKLTHPRREEETALGNLVADVFAERSGEDVVLIGSGAIRLGYELGPVVTLRDLRALYPYDGVLVKLAISGAQLVRIFEFFMAQENHHEDGKLYQVNRGVQAVYNSTGCTLESLVIDGQPVRNDGRYTICVLEHHYRNAAVVLSLSSQELAASGKPQVVTTSARDVLEAYLSPPLESQQSSRRASGMCLRATWNPEHVASWPPGPLRWPVGDDLEPTSARWRLPYGRDARKHCRRRRALSWRND